jgi:acyl carrier protein
MRKIHEKNSKALSVPIFQHPLKIVRSGELIMTLINNYTETQIEQIIKEHIVQKLMYRGTDVILSNEVPLIEAGILDSMSIFRLASFLEEKFGFTLNPEEFLMENFETVNAIKSLVFRKL